MAEERDFVLARLGAARAHVSRITEGLDACIDFFLFPDEDLDGDARKEIIEGILDDIGGLTRSIDAAQSKFDEVDFTEGEPDFDEEDEDEDDEDEDDEDEAA